MSTTTVTASAIQLGVYIAAAPSAGYGPAPGTSYRYPLQPGFDLVHERTEAGWIVLDRVTGIHGYGDGPLAAAVDFRTAAWEHLDVLERQADLSEALRHQLAYLRERLPGRI